MNYYLNPEDEKKLNEEILIQNQALDDIINNQQAEEQLVKDDYNNLDSRVNRFLQVFGAGLRGENASQVARDLSNEQQTKLTNARNKYKDNRDALYNRLKDTRARREAINKAKYDRDFDEKKLQTQIDQFNKTMKYNYDNLNANLQDKNTKKIEAENEATRLNNEAEARNKSIQSDIDKGMKSMYNTGIGSDVSKTKKAAFIQNTNTEIARELGVKEENIAKFIENDPRFPTANDTPETIEYKYYLLNHPSQRLKDKELNQKLTFIDNFTGSRDDTKKLVQEYGSVDEVIKFISSQK